MNLAAIVAGFLTTVTIALGAAMPWGGGDTLRVALPLLPIAAIAFWSLRRPEAMPAVSVFSCGLLIDLMVQAPLGFWTLIALIIALCARLFNRAGFAGALLRRTLAVLVLLAVSAALSWALASLYSFQVLPLWVHINGLGIVALAYAALSRVLVIVDALVAPNGDGQAFGRGS